MKGAAGKKVTAFAGMIGELSGMRATAEAYELGLEIAVRSGIIGTYKMQQTPGSGQRAGKYRRADQLGQGLYRRTKADRGRIGRRRAGARDARRMAAKRCAADRMDNEKPEERNKVTMMTVHGAKGLEFEYVYVAGLEENLFPSMMEPRQRGGARRGAPAVLRGVDAGQTGSGALVRRVAF